MNTAHHSLSRVSVQGISVTMRVNGKDLPQWLVNMAIALVKTKREFQRYDIERIVKREAPTAANHLQDKATTVLLQGLKRAGLICHVSNGEWHATDRAV